MRTIILAAAFLSMATLPTIADSSDKENADSWRALPLINSGKVDPSWVHIGYGRFVVEDGSLKTESSENGLGLLLYEKEKLGNCQIRVVFKTKDARSNAGVYVRIDDGILEQRGKTHAPATRTESGELTFTSAKMLLEASEKGVGPWYAVHHGYEVQICDAAGPFSRTGAIYSLAESKVEPEGAAGKWRTMVITLDGKNIQVQIDGQKVSNFDSDSKEVPQERKWYEPKREPKRPEVGYIGLQTHDPGDVVYFKEISVRPLDSK